MNIIEVKTFNAYRANKFGYAYSTSDKLIMTRSFVHTHTELKFSPRYNGVSFSSTLQDDAKGCRFKQIEYSHPERWDTVRICITDEEEDLAYNHARSIEGMPYDLLGLLSFSTELEIIKPDKYGRWCTEAVLECIKKIERLLTIPLEPEKAHPTLGHIILQYYFENLPTPKPCPLCGQYVIA